MIYILSKLGELKTILSNDNPKSCTYSADLLTEKIEYGEMRLDFSVPANHDDAALIDLDDIAATLDSKNQLVPLKITYIDSGRDSNGQELRIVECNNQGSELLKHPVRPMTLNGVTQRQALEQILAGSGWEAGIVEYSDVKDFEVSDYSNGVKEVHNIVDKWGGEVRFHVEISEGRIKRKTIDLYQVRGNQEGYGVRRFESGRDVLEIRKQSSARQIYTAIIGLGKQDESGKATTFTEISQTYTNENGTKVTKPVGQDWIGDPDALQEWGLNGKHAFGYYFNSEESNPSVILDESWKYLQQNKKPNPVFVTDVSYFKQVAGYSEDDEIQIGDKVTVSVLDFNPPLVLSARVLELQTSKSDPTKNKVALGEYQELKIKRFDSISAIQRIIRDKQTKITAQPNEPSDPKNNPYWINTSRTPNVLMRFDNENSKYVKASPTEAVEVGAETPEGAKEKADEALENSKDYTNNNTLIKNQYYNGLYWNDLDGLIVEREDGMVRSVFNATTGIAVQVLDGTDWTDVFFIDTNGRLKLAGDVTSENSEGTERASLTNNSIEFGTSELTKGTMYYDRSTDYVIIDAGVGILLQSSRSFEVITHELYLKGNLRIDSNDGRAIQIEGAESAFLNFLLDEIQTGYVGMANPANSDMYLASNIGHIRLSSATNIVLFTNGIAIDTTDNIARWMRNNNDYIRQDDGGRITFYMGGTVKHAFNPDGTKSGGSIEVDGKNLGMSPIDSPQVLLEYIEFDIPLSEEGSKVFIDPTFRKTVERFAVFPNNGTVIEKGIDYFVVKGTGTADIRITGERIGYKNVFYADLEIMDTNGEIPIE